MHSLNYGDLESASKLYPIVWEDYVFDGEVEAFDFSSYVRMKTISGLTVKRKLRVPNPQVPDFYRHDQFAKNDAFDWVQCAHPENEDLLYLRLDEADQVMKLERVTAEDEIALFGFPSGSDEGLMRLLVAHTRGATLTESASQPSLPLTAMALMAPAVSEGGEAVCLGLELWFREQTNGGQKPATSEKNRYSLIARRAGGSWGLRHSDLWFKACLERDQSDASEFEGIYRVVLDPMRFPAFLALFDYVGYAQPSSVVSFFFDDLDREVDWSELPWSLLAHAVEGREVLRQKPHPSLDELVALSYLDEVGESREVDSLGVFANSLGVAVTALTKMGGPSYDPRWELLRARLITQFDTDLGSENSVHVFFGSQHEDCAEDVDARIFFEEDRIAIWIDHREPVDGRQKPRNQQTFEWVMPDFMDVAILRNLRFEQEDYFFERSLSSPLSSQLRAYLVVATLRDVMKMTLQCVISYEFDSLNDEDDSVPGECIWKDDIPVFES
jgi:hypothetical protein